MAEHIWPHYVLEQNRTEQYNDRNVYMNTLDRGQGYRGRRWGYREFLLLSVVSFRKFKDSLTVSFSITFG